MVAEIKRMEGPREFKFREWFKRNEVALLGNTPMENMMLAYFDGAYEAMEEAQAIMMNSVEEVGEND